MGEISLEGQKENFLSQVPPQNYETVLCHDYDRSGGIQ